MNPAWRVVLQGSRFALRFFLVAGRLPSPPTRRRDEDAASPAARPAQRQRTAGPVGLSNSQPDLRREPEHEVVRYDRATQQQSRRDELIARLHAPPWLDRALDSHTARLLTHELV